MAGTHWELESAQEIKQTIFVSKYKSKTFWGFWGLFVPHGFCTLRYTISLYRYIHSVVIFHGYVRLPEGSSKSFRKNHCSSKNLISSHMFHPFRTHATRNYHRKPMTRILVPSRSFYHIHVLISYELPISVRICLNIAMSSFLKLQVFLVKKKTA